MKRKNEPNCFECEHREYIGDGDFLCTQHNEVVLTSFSLPTDEYLFCDGKDFVFNNDEDNDGN